MNTKFDVNKVGDEIKARIAQIDKAEGDLIEHKRAAAALLQGVARNHSEYLNAVCERAGLKKSRRSELLQIVLGRKSEAEVRNATKKRVAKHRAAKRRATSNPSVTDPVTDDAVARPSEPVASPHAKSLAALGEFKFACDHYLGRMNADHRFTAIEYARSLKEGLDAREAIKQEAQNAA
jgi:hypothetical protein